MTIMNINFHHLKNDQSVMIKKIFGSSLAAVDPYQVVHDAITLEKNILEIRGYTYDLDDIDRVLLVGMGKAAIAMAAGAYTKLRNVIDEGVVVAKHANDNWDLPEEIKILYGSHPLPTSKSINSASAIIKFVKQSKDDDLIINLISGGGSALVTSPVEPLEIEDIKNLTKSLLQSGATIQEINTIRKHIDAVKGGGVAEIAGMTPMISLILSDVLGDDISMIASGPTCGDPTTFEHARDIIRKYQLESKISPFIIDTLKSGIKGNIKETLKPNSPLLHNKHHYIVGNITKSIKSAKQTAEELGFNTSILSTFLSGEAREIGRAAGSILKTVSETDLVVERPALIIAGGETTVTVKGDGLGGRNQEIAFGALDIMDGLRDCTLVSFATDGEDGPTDAAGAYVTGNTFRRAIDAGLAPVGFGENNDTYSLFNQLGNLIRVGPTGTNVNDLLFLFAFQ